MTTLEDPRSQWEPNEALRSSENSRKPSTPLRHWEVPWVPVGICRMFYRTVRTWRILSCEWDFVEDLRSLYKLEESLKIQWEPTESFRPYCVLLDFSIPTLLRVLEHFNLPSGPPPTRGRGKERLIGMGFADLFKNSSLGSIPIFVVSSLLH